MGSGHTSTPPPRHYDHPPHPSPPQQIYVLAADGSRLYLVDPSKPHNEEPPPYAPFSPPQSHHPLPSSSGLGISTSSTSHASHSSHVSHASHTSPPSSSHRHRASTLSALQPPTLSATGRPLSYRSVRPGSSIHTTRTRSRTSLSSSAYSPIPDETTPLLSPPIHSPTHSAHIDHEVEDGVESHDGPADSAFRAIWAGEVDPMSGRRKFWAPVAKTEYWRAVLHLLILNFPFALFVWPPLLVGTLVGTVLLITLPLGATVWWLTLIIARTASRVETIMQLQHHSPLQSVSTYHPIFHRIKDGSPVPLSSETVGAEGPPSDLVWETRFLPCSWAMFCDHYSYSSLSYFLLIKPVLTLFPTIGLVALFPIAVVFFPLLPVYLRTARRWGQWQANVAMVNL